MGLQQGHGAHHASGGALRTLGITGRQFGEVGLPLGDAEVELPGQGGILNAEQAVDHLVELVLAGQEALLGAVGEVLFAVAIDPAGQFRLPEGIGFREPMDLEVLDHCLAGGQPVGGPPGLATLDALLFADAHISHSCGNHALAQQGNEQAMAGERLPELRWDGG